jgi:hypothetical protein
VNLEEKIASSVKLLTEDFQLLENLLDAEEGPKTELLQSFVSGK